MTRTLPVFWDLRQDEQSWEMPCVGTSGCGVKFQAGLLQSKPCKRRCLVSPRGLDDLRFWAHRSSQNSHRVSEIDSKHRRATAGTCRNQVEANNIHTPNPEKHCQEKEGRRGWEDGSVGKRLASKCEDPGSVPWHSCEKVEVLVHA